METTRLSTRGGGSDMKAVDTNILVRLLTADDARPLAAAQAVFRVRPARFSKENSGHCEKRYRHSQKSLCTIIES